MRKIKISCRTWDQVEKLCDEQSAGNHLTVRGAHDLKRGDQLTVALRLPDELVLSLAAEVESVRTDSVKNEPVTSVYIVGLTPEVCTRMRSMSNQSKPNLRLSYMDKRVAAAEPVSTPPGQVIGGLRLRKPGDD